MKRNPKKSVSAVHIVNGSRVNQAAGSASIAITPNISTADAGRVGIRSTPAAFVRAALTGGFGHRAFAVRNGRDTLIGMKKRLTDFQPIFRLN